jgi:hypothetical protein
MLPFAATLTDHHAMATRLRALDAEIQEYASLAIDEPSRRAALKLLDKHRELQRQLAYRAEDSYRGHPELGALCRAYNDHVRRPSPSFFRPLTVADHARLGVALKSLLASYYEVHAELRRWRGDVNDPSVRRAEHLVKLVDRLRCVLEDFAMLKHGYEVCLHFYYGEPFDRCQACVNAGLVAAPAPMNSVV